MVVITGGGGGTGDGTGDGERFLLTTFLVLLVVCLRDISFDLSEEEELDEDLLDDEENVFEEGWLASFPSRAAFLGSALIPVWAIFVGRAVFLGSDIMFKEFCLYMCTVVRYLVVST